MDIWHRVGRIVRFSNLGTVLFFVLNILLITAVFGTSGNVAELIIIYFVTVAISLSPIGEACLAAFAGAKNIKRTDIQLRVIPLVQYVLDKAKTSTSLAPAKVKVMIVHDSAPNAFAIGRQTLCITDGLLALPDDMMLGILAHEIGHLAYQHTVIQLLIGGGNIFISGCLALIKITCWVFSAIMGLFAFGFRSRLIAIATALFAGISTALTWLWVKFCMLFLMWSMRQNEYLADEFAYKIGFGLELATALDKHISDVPNDGFFRALYDTHPCNDDRVAALQNLGVPYSRY
ncbi:MAG: M48 family metalloprotease [Lachnospiraceae bacterium]|nr:M48 family metalloprotease [Lachnospiraceae bacterium]